METSPVRVWGGVHEAIFALAKQQHTDASVLASLLLMKGLFEQKDLPQAAQVAIAKDFFEMLGNAMTESKTELAEWAVKAMQSGK